LTNCTLQLATVGILALAGAGLVEDEVGVTPLDASPRSCVPRGSGGPPAVDGALRVTSQHEAPVGGQEQKEPRARREQDQAAGHRADAAEVGGQAVQRRALRCSEVLVAQAAAARPVSRDRVVRKGVKRTLDTRQRQARI
jgi:hypothetical protein